MTADAAPTTALRVTHRSSVTADQIDHLGHMNVRFYAVNALAATDAVLRDLPGWGDRDHVVHDVYTRHHREQLEGTRLEVRSAVLGASPEGLRLHHELAAPDRGELAATFVHVVSPHTSADGRTPVPDAAVAAAQAEAIELPSYAAPRTASLEADLAGSAPTLDELRARGLAMRHPRRVWAEECDAQGRYLVEMAPMLTWAGQPIGGDTGGQARETPDGKLMAWASMETRVVLHRLPSVGTRIQSFGAGVAVHDKVTHRIHWAYDLDSGELLTAFEAVSLAFDIRARRPMSLPEDVRAFELHRLQPDLAPRPARG